MDEQEWRAQNAARVRQALQSPQVRAELLAHLGIGDDDRRRARRLEQARRELEGLELRWRIEEDAWEPSK